MKTAGTNIVVSKKERNEETAFYRRTGVNFRSFQLAHELDLKVNEILEGRSLVTDVTRTESTPNMYAEMVANCMFDNMTIVNASL